MKKNILIILIAIIIISSCKNESENSTTTVETTYIKAPVFNADTAYQHIATQVAMGPRVPGTAAQKKCAAWMQEQLNKYCDSVYVQNTIVTQPVSNKKFPCINVIGEINPQAASRVLLLCHWDSRGMADEDVNKANHNKAIDAADDAASGVAVLIEIAKAIRTQKLDIGVDILMSDVEDMGRSEWEGPNGSSYCLGTRYWALNPHKANYKANFGICLDMVGAKGATFMLEQNSKYIAPDWQAKVWHTASRLGHSTYFINQDGIGTTDDHMEVNNIMHIPTIDIINISQQGFGKHWHTMNDNINVIDKNTLKAVGETVLGVLYNY